MAGKFPEISCGVTFPEISGKIPREI